MTSHQEQDHQSASMKGFSLESRKAYAGPSLVARPPATYSLALTPAYPPFSRPSLDIRRLEVP